MKKILTTLILLPFLFACSKEKDSSNPLVGFWSRSYIVPVCNVATTESYEFCTDGSCIHLRQSDRVDPSYKGSTHPIDETLSYSIIDDQTLSIGKYQYSYTLSSDNKTLTLDGHRFTRK